MKKFTLLMRTTVCLFLVFTFLSFAGCGDGSLADTLAEGMGRQIQAQEKASQEAKQNALQGKAPAQGEVLLYEDTSSQPLTQEREVTRLFMIGNDMSMFNGGTPAEITLKKRTYIKSLGTYHWNDAKGQPGGTVSIKDASGKIYGPWQATTSEGQGGVPNAYWKVFPEIELPAGTYTIIDSDPATWSQNEGTGGQGSTWADGWEVE